MILSLAGMVLFVPGVVWLATGSLSDAWFALKGYLVAMGVIAVPTLALAGLVLLAESLARL